jgi:hypothetical protein
MTADFAAILDAWLAGTAPQAWLRYAIGSEFYGETHARFAADGAYAVWSTVTEGRERLEFTGRIDPARVVELVNQVAAAEPWTARHVKAHQSDDDALAVLEVGNGDRSYRVELWVSEIPQVPNFDRAQQPVLSLTRELSDGVILESGR